LKESSIREYLLDRIAEFKAPSRVFILDEIPKGATGKLNRSELSARFTQRVFGQVAELEDGLEEKIAGIYREVLSVEKIGSSDNFFELGGDSIRATQVINRVRALFQINLSMALVFRKPTVSELAAEITQMIGNVN
jgi:acyl carrier protein